MKINIETLIITAIETDQYIYQGLWTITKKDSELKQFYFYRCESEFKPDNPNDIYINELYCFIETALLKVDSTLNQTDALYLLKYALHETIQLMHTNPRLPHKIFSSDKPLEEMLESLVPNFNVKQLQSLPDEIGFAAKIDFNPQDEIGQNASKLLIGNTLLH